MAQDDLIIPIPGTTKLENLEENLDAVDIVLTKEQLASIRKAVDDVGGAAGTRATAAEMGSLFQ